MSHPQIHSYRLTETRFKPRPADIISHVTHAKSRCLQGTGQHPNQPSHSVGLWTMDSFSTLFFSPAALYITSEQHALYFISDLLISKSWDPLRALLSPISYLLVQPVLDTFSSGSQEPIVHISSQLCVQRRHNGSLKSAAVRVFTPQKSK